MIIAVLALSGGWRSAHLCFPAETVPAKILVVSKPAADETGYDKYGFGEDGFDSEGWNK